jgi:hypothetical protein
MAYLYHIVLGNLSYYTATGAESGAYAGGSNPTSTLDNVGPFINFQSYGYWSSTEYIFPSYAWYFNTIYGNQRDIVKTNSLYALAFRYGDVAVTTVPVPAAVWLFGSGLLGLIGMARRKAA